MKEHNNRKKANQFAEYITGKELRKYLADKINKYCGGSVSVFDGAAGSGQLEQYLNLKEFHAVEIQEEACEALKYNYPKAVVSNTSFFQYDSDYQADAVAMNPPFSLKFKDLSEDDRQAIQLEFPWKKSGVVDDVFMLKAMKYTKRFGFFIMFPGIAYRGAEKKMRKLIGNRLAELNAVRNGFEDTNIEVLFLVIDKEKTNSDVHREIYDAKLKKAVYIDGCQLSDDYHWEIPREPPVKEEIDIDAVNKELDDLAVNHLEKHLMTNLLVIQQFQADIDYLAFIRRCRDLLDQYETYYRFGASV
jgi:predicted RNA methylase